jgi:hypothetical protein
MDKVVKINDIAAGTLRHSEILAKVAALTHVSLVVLRRGSATGSNGASQTQLSRTQSGKHELVLPDQRRKTRFSEFQQSLGRTASGHLASAGASSGSVADQTIMEEEEEQPKPKVSEPISMHDC